jgi:outer membrane protein OmpA-like peptidoglycan-associated protein
MNPFESKNWKRAVGVLLMMAAATSRASAADIAWATAVDETGRPPDLLTEGKFMAAVTAGRDTTVNGVRFVGQTPSKTASLIIFGTAPITVEAVQNHYGQYGTPPATWDAGYRSLVSGGAYSEFPTSPMKIQISGLTIGNKYAVQILETFWNANFATVFVGGQNQSSALNLSGGPRPGAAASSTAQYVTGTFTADSDRETISLTSTTGYVIFDAIQLRDMGAGNPNKNQIISALRAGATAGSAPSLDLSIEFETGSSALTPAAIQELEMLGGALTSSDLAADKFRIEGHTDTVGTAAANKILSQQRADAVASYLETKFGIAANRLQAVGVGEADLLVPTPDQTPELRNRRVHIVNLGAQVTPPK